MPLCAGARLGPYEILAPIGKGGMGEVYSARDTRLNRDVAVKVLPQSFATESARERFQREARAASALNHPNICAVFDVGESQGHPFLVMELLTGKTLREHIGGKPLDISGRARAERPGGRRAGGSPRQRHRSSRYQAGQYFCERTRSRQGARLRPGDAKSAGGYEQPRMRCSRNRDRPWARSPTCRRNRRAARRGCAQ